MYKVYEPYIRARLGTAAHFCEVVVLKPEIRNQKIWNQNYVGVRASGLWFTVYGFWFMVEG